MLKIVRPYFFHPAESELGRKNESKLGLTLGETKTHPIVHSTPM